VHVDGTAEQQFLVWAESRTRQLQRTAFLLCGNWHTAEDIVQEALTRVALHWNRVSASGSPDAYVRRALVNGCRQRWRRRSTRSEVLPAELPDVDIPDGADERAVRDELLAALRQLPTRQRMTIVLRYFEQLTEAETAAAMSCSIGTVKSTTHRALEALNSW
jgi:RNA polymerase sigma-70 factor (sigma-E family)